MTEPTEAELRRLADFIARRTGMVFTAGRTPYVARRLADRMTETGIGSVAIYLALLDQDAAEAEQLVNRFTVNETYFFREEHQFRCMVADLLPARIAGKRPGDRLRIWSLPCATGEEPYSIALWLLENWALVDAYNVEILGSDIDTRALVAARGGIFGERALARLPASVRADYFAPTATAGQWRLIADLRESVGFSTANLIDRATLAPHGRFDIVFCRNVLIYFDEPARQVAAANLHDALLPGGFLCLGHSESMSRISDRLAPRRFADGVVFQRADGDDG